MAEKPVVMEATVPEAKYQKLATEYSKLRAKATVLKRAVEEHAKEQAKEGGLREQVQQYATSLRRMEQEVDSLGFRNKQLESRVSQLQQEISLNEQRQKKEKDAGGRRGLLGNSSRHPEALADAHADAASEANAAQEALIFEELQKKIMENAQLTSLIDDKQRDLLLHTERIASLEQKLEKRIGDQNELERRLRKEVEALQHRNSELETKLVDATSMLGSEDALSATGSDNTPLHNLQQQQQQPNSAQLTSDDRIAILEKEAAHWRAQFEVAKLHQAFVSNPSKDLSTCSCSTAAAGVTVRPAEPETKGSQRARDSLQEPPEPPSKEQLIYSVFSKKFEDLLRLKVQAESKLRSYELEAQHLQNCLENATHELKAKDEQLGSLGGALQMLEEELTTTRINYEEQISVLTEQVISLSDQLAACK
ncbi:protein phosphatase 1 regulatory subunit 21 [Drosophila kikkawai]|uniref:Protein phosphatase 1 regulatory subunit 21 n=1 Tax=Drosophila kikkawai TaxID=30033 RepID=A0A6P4ICR0_DROKI|nr:protein phosphatase 1 regulatory subunit 21 [Drosophila kikkawai]